MKLDEDPFHRNLKVHFILDLQDLAQAQLPPPPHSERVSGQTCQLCMLCFNIMSYVMSSYVATYNVLCHVISQVISSNVLLHVIPCHISCDVISCYVMTWHMSCYVIITCHVTCHVSCHVMSSYVMQGNLCYVISYHTSHHVLSCCYVIYHVMPCAMS